MSKKEITLNEMRQLQIGLLDEIHAFCTKNSIRYSLTGGSLIGPVRNKGYIPWDDDIDIMLPRPDYEKFLKEFVPSKEYVKLQSLHTDDTYCYPFAKVYDTRTVLIEYGAKNGIYVDVFPIDGWPDKKDVDAFYNDFLRINKLVTKTTAFYKFRKHPLLYKIKYYLKKIFYPSRRKVLSMLDDLFARYPFEKAEYVGGVVGSYGKKESVPRTVFQKYTSLPFEGKEYSCISDYDTYLSTVYGDYMQLPPKEKRVSHHVFEAYWI